MLVTELPVLRCHGRSCRVVRDDDIVDGPNATGLNAAATPIAAAMVTAATVVRLDMIIIVRFTSPIN